MKIKLLEAKKHPENYKLKVCAYVRVSTDHEEQENSLINQEQHYREIITSNPKYEFVGIYSDQGKSGYKENRPQFQKMIQEARDGKIDLILTKSISRFARNTATVLKFVRELKSLGVGIFFELQNINTLSAEGELMITILSAFAQAESDGASNNTLMAYKRKFEQGNHQTRVQNCYGYCLDEEGNLQIDPTQALYVKKMYELANEGVWPSRITRYLSEVNAPTKTGKPWHQSVVTWILRNEVYKGDICTQRTYLDANRVRRMNNGHKDRYYIKGNHEGIIEPELWEKVQEKLEERLNGLYEVAPIETRDNLAVYPLSGLMYCPHCGAVLHRAVDKKKGLAYWICKTVLRKSSSLCKGMRIPDVKALELNIVAPAIIDYELDQYGEKVFFTQDKGAYEKSGNCPYDPEKVAKQKVGRPIYPLTKKLYCSKCGATLNRRTKWSDNVGWDCSNYRRRGPSACEGISVPEEIASSWNIVEEVIVTEGVDKGGRKSYSYTSKSKC